MSVCVCLSICACLYFAALTLASPPSQSADTLNWLGHHQVLLSSGSIDSNWVVGATLEKKLLPLPLSLALGAFLNHRKNKFQCGFGITIG